MSKLGEHGANACVGMAAKELSEDSAEVAFSAWETNIKITRAAEYKFEMKVV